MRFKFNKEVEYFIKKFFVSEKFLLKKRLKRAINNEYDQEIGLLDKVVNKKIRKY